MLFILNGQAEGFYTGSEWISNGGGKRDSGLMSRGNLMT